MKRLTQKSNAHKKTAGFSLMEMTVVLLVTSVVAAGGLQIYTKKDQEDKLALTNKRLNTIEDSLNKYRFAHHRLPCPADGSIAEGVTNFGFEAAIAGSCTGGAPAANFVASNTAEGVVPVRTLQLPNEAMYDGWGRRIMYAVDARATGMDALVTTGVYSSAVSGITIKDAQGGTRTSTAIYTLISYGKDGHGAYLQSGSRLNAAATNADELDNAGVDTNFASTFDNVFVMRGTSDNSSDYKNLFDDIVRYKQRWNIAQGNDESIYTPSGTAGGSGAGAAAPPPAVPPPVVPPPVVPPVGGGGGGDLCAGHGVLPLWCPPVPDVMLL